MRERCDEGKGISFIGIEGMRDLDDKSGDAVRSIMKLYGFLSSRSSTLTERYPRYPSCDPMLVMLCVMDFTANLLVAVEGDDVWNTAMR